MFSFAQVYKFSKFIHGSAVLLTELVAAAPYWIDDVSIRDSINSSAPTGPNQRRTPIGAPPGKDKKSKDDDTMTMTSFGESFSQLKTLPVPEGDPADSVTHPLIARTSASTRPHGQYTDFLRSTAAPGGGDEECSCCGLMAGAKKLPRKASARSPFLMRRRLKAPMIHTTQSLPEPGESHDMVLAGWFR